MNRPPTGQSRRWTGVGLLALGHGLGDFNAGALLAILGARSGADLVTLYLLYNVLAFAGQPFAGLICDRMGRVGAWFGLGGALSAVAMVLVWSRPEVAVICSGVASAFYHSAGGAKAWELGGESALAASVFAAPGVVGLALGLAFGGSLTVFGAILSGGGLVAVLALFFVITAGLAAEEGRRAGERGISLGLVGGVLSWLIVLAIAVRSFAWSLGQETFFPPEYAVGLAVAAALGKAVAGWLADKLGAGKVTVGALALAAGFLMPGGTQSWWFFPAVVALQAGTGPMMALVLREWPRHPAFGSGLAQGLAVALGGVPLLMLSRLASAPVILAAVALVVAAAIMAAVLWRLKAREGAVPRPM